jgi:predicted nucleic acid-binding protein
MILVDTSVWVDHLRNSNAQLIELLNNDQVLMHPFIIGELSLGILKNRTELMDLFSRLPVVPVAEHDEVMATIAAHQLFGMGIGWVDAHLIASALLSNSKLLTNDKPLIKASKVVGVDALS